MDDKPVLVTVSVPFRGISFLNCVISLSNCSPPVCFRPLPGYLISQFYSMADSKELIESFPSPSGVSHFSMSSSGSVKYCLAVVSVPFRGISFLNLSWKYELDDLKSFRPLPGYLISQSMQTSMFTLTCSMVSVPFRGISFLNSKSVCLS